MNERKLRMLINNLTQDIINIYNIQIPIINIDEVVIKLGGRVESSAMNNVSDACVKKQNDGFIIFVSPFQSAERRTFTIAHELGHLFLHMGYQINGELWEKSDNLVFYENAKNTCDFSREMNWHDYFTKMIAF